MNNLTRILSVSNLALALASEAAYADPGKTREQVQAELAAAQKAGDIIVGDQGLSLRELYPSQYPPVATGPGKTREQVTAELVAAQQNGDIAMNFAGKTERELFPGTFENTTTTTSQAYVAHDGSPVFAN